ncbi:MAG TPA: helix-turn-helix transcriptional regulator [Bacteroidales bacterium]|nr:helix-turn-helix transcriptional regulator [Bacteroidales bacterium]HRW83864.1 helix-turn-helix transcriptional regulator [Bacteroidales bacterium]
MKNHPDITQIEDRIMILVKRGHTNRTISSKLCKSPDTIKYHLKKIYRKLDAVNRIQAINKYNDLEGTKK